MASHLTVSLLPSSTIIGFFIGFNFGAAAKNRERQKKTKNNKSVIIYRHGLDYGLVCVSLCVLGGDKETATEAVIVSTD